ncbi:uncharacterized protein CXorf38 homolog [Salarias fasciatus]|uniref:uncharacterized protein CXorf38 homolog n=1 Tax=Salarias fasciatus TaxID=181472 RepID=UPI001176B81D|nr:uncharacterized protein CXorf38 homolog [Salarias fasciatus]
MPRGQFSKRADQCDTSALLNLICNCKGFWFVDPKVVREVIRSRNELMHSSEFHMSDDWMRDFQSSLKCFVLQLVNQNPQMETVARQIDVMLKLDLSISVDCRDGVEADSMCEASPSADSVRQWEAELLQELLQEFLHTPAEDEDADAPDTEQLTTLCGFLEANKDLGQRFSAEIQLLNSRKAKGGGGGANEEV